MEAAVVAHRAALEEWTRERVPLLWAAAQGNVGNALATLGKRESETDKLEEAVEAYRAALEEQTRSLIGLVILYSNTRCPRVQPRRPYQTGSN